MGQQWPVPTRHNPLLLPTIWAQTAAGQRKRPFGSLATMSSKFVIMAVNR